MDQRGAEGVVLTLLLLLSFGAGIARGESCYSARGGYVNCWNGCCGADHDQRCCSSLLLVLGLGIGGGIFVLAVVVLIFCWACKDCRPKTCFDQDPRQRDRRSRRDGRVERLRRVTVYPVSPPDYNTATQERAPSVQPGLYNRNLPLSPPPPYTETAPHLPGTATGFPPPSASSQSPRRPDQHSRRVAPSNMAVTTAIAGTMATRDEQRAVTGTIDASSDSVERSSHRTTSTPTTSSSMSGESTRVIGVVPLPQSSGSAPVLDSSPSTTHLDTESFQLSNALHSETNQSVPTVSESEDTTGTNSVQIDTENGRVLRVSGNGTRRLQTIEEAPTVARDSPQTSDTRRGDISQEDTRTRHSHAVQVPNTSSTMTHRLGESSHGQDHLSLI